MWERRTLTGLLAALLPAVELIALAGCGADSGRLAVSGKVEFDGVPLDQGSIRLTSSGTGTLFASGAMIHNGEFYIPKEKGLPPGSYLVEISAPDPSAPLVVYRGAPGEPTLPPTAPERIPAEYNVNSKQTVNVTTDGDNHFVIEIASRPSK
jgi:hypothetical protein